MIDTINAVKSPYKERKTLFMMAEELGLKFQKTQCSKCCNDLYNIIREELGLIGNAAELSDFNKSEESESGYRYIYKLKRPIGWMGNRMDQNTPVEVIEDFVKRTGNEYYIRVKADEKPTTEESINNEESL